MRPDWERLIQQNMNRVWQVGTSTPVRDSRNLVIMAACDLEEALQGLLLALLKYLNPKHNRATSEEVLLDQYKPWSGLKRQADIAWQLGLLSKNERDDLKKLADIRNKYAHHRSLGVLTDEPKMLALLHKCHAYHENKKRFDAFPAHDRDQSAFCAIRDYYIELFQHRADVLCEKPGKGLSELPIKPGDPDW